jgi:hypothetical protein
MEGMTVRVARISIATFCVAIAACGSEAPQTHRTSSLNRYPPVAQFCQVGIQSCLSVNPRPARPCLASAERCTTEARVQLIDAIAGNGP